MNIYLKRTGAVLGGLLAGAIVTTAVDMVFHATGVYPPWDQRMSDPLFVLAASYRVVFNIGGCYLAAKLAPDFPMRHALAIGVIGLFLSTAGAIAMWDKGPAWYSILNIAIALPCAWAGGKLYLRATT
jgi:hypothetical protein